MARIVGVRFRNVGKVYYFDPLDFEIHMNDHVIVETARGIEYGNIVFTPKEVSDDEVVYPLKEVIRVATPDDDERERANRIHEKEAFRICKEKILEHNLDMKLIQAEYTFDNNKVLFYFTADGRIDFRQLVKDLASIFKTRIELRQIGVRDETKILGGIGICGRPLCCHSYLTDFAPVSIKMAKTQNLSLNQSKISGVCGRLMCCLKNEEETYEELNKKLPRSGDLVTMPDGTEGVVHTVNILRQTVRVVIERNDEREIVEYPADDLVFQSRKKKNKGSEQESRKPEKKEKKSPEEREKKSQDEKPEKGAQGGKNPKPENSPQSGKNPKQENNAQGSRSPKPENKAQREQKNLKDQKERQGSPEKKNVQKNREEKKAEERRSENSGNEEKRESRRQRRRRNDRESAKEKRED